MPEAMELLFRVKVEGAEQFDRIVATIRGVQGGTESAGRSLSGFEKGLGGAAREGAKLSEVSGNLGNSLRAALANPLGAASGALETLAGKLGAAGVAGMATGTALVFVGSKLLSLTQELGKAAEQTINFADRLGVSVSAAERLRAAAEIAGVEVSALESAGLRVAAALEDTTGAGEKTATAMRRLGVSIFTATGEKREMGQVLLDVLDRLGGVANSAERTRLATEILGRGAKELGPLIKNYGELQQRVAELGVGLDSELTEKLAKTDDAFDRLGKRIEQLKKALVEPLVSPLADLLDRIVNPFPMPQTSAQRPFGDGDGFDARAINDYLKSRGLRVILPGDEARERFRSQIMGTEEGRKRRLGSLGKEMSELETMLLSGNLNEETFAAKKAEYDKLAAEARQIEAQIKAAQERQSVIASLPNLLRQSRLAGLTALERLNVEQEELLKKLGPGFDEKVAEIFRNPRQVEIAKILGQNRTDLARVVKENEEEARRTLDYSSKSFSDQLRKRIEEDEKAIRGLRGTVEAISRNDQDRWTRSANRDLRLIELTSERGGEMAAAESVYRIKLDLARQIYDEAVRLADLEEDSTQRDIALIRARGDLEKAIDDARLDRETKILETRRKALDDYRDQAGRVFDALTASGGGGLRDYIKGTVRTFERQVFVNASAEIFRSLGSTLGGIIPGQTGADGKPTILGTLLSGTIFDSKNRTLETVTKDNTAETKKNTAAMVAMTYAMQSALSPGSGGGALMAGGIPDISSLPGGDYLGKWMTIFNPLGGGVPGGTNAAKAPSTMSQFFSGLLGGTLSGNPLGVIFTPSGESVQLGPGRAGSFSTAERIGTAIGTASVIAGGAYGVYSGIKQGGARGATTAISSAAGTAAALDPEPISKAVLMGVSLVSGLIGGLLGDPRKEYDEAVTAALKRNKKDWPADVERTTDLYGNDVDYDYRGRTRVVNHQPVVVQITAMDAKSIMDRQGDIADALTKAIRLGHPVRQGIQEAAFS